MAACGRVVLLALGCFAAACGGGDDYSTAQLERWCAAVEALPAQLDVDFGAMSLDELMSARDMIDANIVDAAPPDIQDDVAVLRDLDSGTVRISEQETQARAAVRVDSAVRERCDLDLRLSDQL